MKKNIPLPALGNFKCPNFKNKPQKYAISLNLTTCGNSTTLRDLFSGISDS